jgi:hypothetical protein
MISHTKRLLAFLILMTMLAACSFPGPTQAVTENSPTPNLTMTALFSTPFPTQPLPSKTLPPVVTATQPATQVPQPSATPVPPTATAVPPTATAVPPTATAVPPSATPKPPTATPDTSHRPGTSVAAAFMSKAPVMDGGWTDFPVHDYAAQSVVFGKQNWTGSTDLSVSYRIGWDKTNLYLAAKVRDDIYVQNATGADIFKGDSLEILLDTNLSGDFFVTQNSADDYQLGVSFGRPDVNGTKEAWLWQPTNKAGSRTSQVKVAATRNESEHLTRVEVAIPWSVFGVTPKTGMHFGFVFSVSDNDNPSKNVQQIMISSDAGRNLFNPTTWGDLVLK